MQQRPWDKRKHYNRLSGVQLPRKKFFIYTEGKTEEIYFKHYQQMPMPNVFPLDQSDSKRSLVEKVIEDLAKKKASGEFEFDDDERPIDEAWVVMDRDLTPSDTQDKAHYNAALQLANNNEINVAYSNDCFELWYLLHFQEVSGNMDRTTIYQKLSQHLGRTYEKGEASRSMYGEIKDMRAEAIRRAKSLYRKAEQEEDPNEHVNPSTTIHVLVERIMAEPGFRDS